MIPSYFVWALVVPCDKYNQLPLFKIVTFMYICQPFIVSTFFPARISIHSFFFRLFGGGKNVNILEDFIQVSI